jgi:hypothetical protein
MNKGPNRREVKNRIEWLLIVDWLIVHCAPRSGRFFWLYEIRGIQILRPYRTATNFATETCLTMATAMYVFQDAKMSGTQKWVIHNPAFRKNTKIGEL